MSDNTRTILRRKIHFSFKRVHPEPYPLSSVTVDAMHLALMLAFLGPSFTVSFRVSTTKMTYLFGLLQMNTTIIDVVYGEDEKDKDFLHMLYADLISIIMSVRMKLLLRGRHIPVQLHHLPRIFQKGFAMKGIVLSENILRNAERCLDESTPQVSLLMSLILVQLQRDRFIDQEKLQRYWAGNGRRIRIDHMKYFADPTKEQE